jgi:hypothetical protein
MQDIARDTLSWVSMAVVEDQEYALRHSLYREAHSVLIRAGEGSDKTDGVDPELLSTIVKWASLEYFSYNEYRDWPDEEDGVTLEHFAGLIGKVGISKEEFEKLINDAINEQAEQKAKERNYDGFDQMWGNYSALEEQMLARAQILGIEIGKVHGYGNYLTSWGV